MCAEGHYRAHLPGHIVAPRAVMSNSALLSDAYFLPLRARRGAAKRER